MLWGGVAVEPLPSLREKSACKLPALSKRDTLKEILPSALLLRKCSSLCSLCSPW